MVKVARSFIVVSALLLGTASVVTTPAAAATRYTVFVKASATTVPVGHTVTFSGAVSPNAAGLSVKLQRYYSGAWRGAATKTLTSTSRYAFSVTIDTAGTRSYRVVKPSTRGYGSGISRTVRVFGATGFKTVSVGQDHGCALKYDKTLWCWGSNYFGQRGTNQGPAWSQTPARVGTSTWNTVSAGGFGTCGIRSDNTLWCWGSFETLQGGSWPNIVGYNVNKWEPTRIGTQSTWATVSTSATEVCAKRTNATVACWNRSDVDNAYPNNVTPLNRPYNDWATMQANPWHSNGCGLRQGHEIWCLPSDRNESPFRVITGLWNAISFGYDHDCGLKADATAWCWGNSESGATGQASTSSVPGKFGSSSWRTLAAGYHDTCGIKTTGSLWCWGLNDGGQLGAGPSAPDHSTTALRVGTASDWTSVDIATYSCGTRKEGSLWCWGDVLAPGDDPNAPVIHPTPVRMG